MYDFSGDPYQNYLGGPDAAKTATPLPPNAAPLPPTPPPAGPLMSALVNPTQSLAPPAAPSPDTFQPHHASTLGKIVDVGLALLGFPLLPFTRHAQKQNMQEAMQGFTDNPLGAIQRIAKIPGQEKLAWQLFENYTNEHKDDAVDAARLKYYGAENEARSRGVLSSYLGGISDDAGYQKMLPILRRYSQANGLDPALLPDKYDPTIAQDVIMSGVKPEDLMTLQQRQAYQQQQIKLRQSEIDQTGAYRGARLNQLDTHEKAYEQHNQKMEDIQQQRVDKVGTKQRSSSVMTKYGPGLIGKSGNTMIVVNGGKKYGYVKTGVTPDGKINWTPIGEVPDK